jgi:hypothetical protein
MTVAAQTPFPLAAEIETLVADVPGWSPIDELYTLSLLAHATAHLPGDIVEVGSWCGRSTRVLAAAARDTHGVVHCIDLFRREVTGGEWRRFARFRSRSTMRYAAFEQSTLWAEHRTQVAPLFAEYPQMLDRFRNDSREASRPSGPSS